MLLLSDTYSMVPILVHEFATEACDPEPQPILARARLYRVSLPPDQLNPNGYYDGNLDEAFLTRFDRKKKTGRADLRASAKRIKLPSPGELPGVPVGRLELYFHCHTGQFACMYNFFTWAETLNKTLDDVLSRTLPAVLHQV